MDEKSNTPVVPQVPEENERIGAAQISDSQESSLDTCDTALMPSSTSAVSTETTSTTIVPHNDIEQPTIESLTLEIKFHLNQMGFHVIEVGKRLIQAKEMLPHGEWATWLQNNFQLKKSAAYNFMHIAERFGKNESDSNFQTSGSFDISTFKPSQLVELLALPEGDEEKFIADKAAEGNPVDHMTVKQLRSEIKHWKDEADKVKADSATQIKKWQDTAGALELKVAMQKSVMERHEKNFNDKIIDLEVALDYAQKNLKNLENQMAQQKTVEVPPPDYEDLQREVQELRERPIEVATEFPADYESTKQELATLKERELSFKRDFAVSHALNQFFSLLPTLLHADNLQSVVSASADNDLQSFEQQLAQLAVLQTELKKYLAAWQDTHINLSPIDRDVIITELKQLALQDMKNLTSALLLALVKSFGFDDMSQVPDELLPDLLRKIKAFQFFLLNM